MAQDTAMKAALIGAAATIIAAIIAIYPQIRSNQNNSSSNSDKQFPTTITANDNERGDTVKTTIPNFQKNNTKEDTVKVINHPQGQTNDIKLTQSKFYKNETYVFNFDRDMCGTVRTIITDAKYGFHNLVSYQEISKAHKWADTIWHTKIQCAFFKTQIGKQDDGNTLYLEYSGPPAQAVALFNQIFHQLRICLGSQGENLGASPDYPKNVNYKFNINDSCLVYISYAYTPQNDDYVSNGRTYLRFQSLTYKAHIW